MPKGDRDGKKGAEEHISTYASLIGSILNLLQCLCRKLCVTCLVARVIVM